VIGDAAKLGDQGESVAMFSSLGEALADPQVIAQLGQIEAIEIRAPLVAERSPLAIELSKDIELTIRGIPAATGELPHVRFFAPHYESAMPSEAALQASGGKLTFENLHLELDIAESTSADVALVRLAAGEATDLEFARCVITVDDGSLDNPPPAAVVDVQPASILAPRSVLPVSFRNTIVRGRATLLRMRESQGLDLIWNNGLFISDQPLLLAEGNARGEAANVGETIRVRLDKVTVATTSGLCVLRDTADRPHQPDLEFVSNRCIISADGSLVEHDGVRDVKDYAKALRVAGSNNFYEDTRVFWRVSVDKVEQQEWDWAKWRDHLLMERGGMSLFYSEVHWNRSRSDVLAVAPHARGVDDYTLDPIASKKAMNDDAGFDAKLLPPLTRLAPAPASPTDKPPAEKPASTLSAEPVAPPVVTAP
jgi:hypothetical protein